MNMEESAFFSVYIMQIMTQLGLLFAAVIGELYPISKKQFWKIVITSFVPFYWAYYLFKILLKKVIESYNKL